MDIVFCGHLREKNKLEVAWKSLFANLVSTNLGARRNEKPYSQPSSFYQLGNHSQGNRAAQGHTVRWWHSKETQVCRCTLTPAFTIGPWKKAFCQKKQELREFLKISVLLWENEKRWMDKVPDIGTWDHKTIKTRINNQEQKLVTSLKGSDERHAGT